MKKIISLLLALATIFLLTVPCFAMENQKASIEEAIALAEDLYPGAKIVVDKAGVLHILPVSTPISVSTRASQIYAPNGGRFSNFVRPPLTDLNAYAPLSIVFLPADEAEAVIIAMEDQAIFDTVIDMLSDNDPVDYIIKTIDILFGVTLTEAAVLFYQIIAVYDVIDALDDILFYSAYSQYGKVCIQQLYLRGNMSNVYLEWSSNYVSAAPFENWNPKFNHGDYSIY